MIAAGFWLRASVWVKRIERNLSVRLCALTIVIATSLAAVASADENADYLLATASTGGTYYPVGVALGALTKVKLQPTEGISLSAINSAGSAENVKLLRDDEVQFAILQGLYGLQARRGSGPFEADGPQSNLRSISLLWRNVEQFVIQTSSVRTGTVADLVEIQGKGLALGARNSGALGSNLTILSNLGFDAESDFTLFYAGYGASGDALQDGRVAGLSTPAGIPTGAISSVFANLGSDVTLLEFTPEQAQKADGGLGLWSPLVIPAGTYAGQDQEIETIAQPNFLAVNADVPEDHVYLLAKAIFENLAFLNGIHKATTDMSLETAITGLPVPLHAGAIRYFDEAGIEVPVGLRTAE